MKEEKEFFTVEEFSSIVRLHENTIRRAIKKGRIQAFRSSDGERSSFRIPNTEIQRLCELDMSKLIKKIVCDELEKINEEK